MGNNIILETKFVADISGSFYIPSYQRGYRWSETEVVRLLDDIYQNGKKNYCLQPVVVRKKEDQYELIDGQQKLTTLYLIYKYMNGVISLHQKVCSMLGMSYFIKVQMPVLKIHIQF